VPARKPQPSPGTQDCDSWRLNKSKESQARSVRGKFDVKST